MSPNSSAPDALLAQYQQAKAAVPDGLPDKPSVATRERIMQAAHAHANTIKSIANRPENIRAIGLNNLKNTIEEQPHQASAANDSFWNIKAVASLAVMGLSALLWWQFEQGTPEERQAATSSLPAAASAPAVVSSPAVASAPAVVSSPVAVPAPPEAAKEMSAPETKVLSSTPVATDKNVALSQAKKSAGIVPPSSSAGQPPAADSAILSASPATPAAASPAPPVAPAAPQSARAESAERERSNATASAPRAATALPPTPAAAPVPTPTPLPAPAAAPTPSAPPMMARSAPPAAAVPPNAEVRREFNAQEGSAATQAAKQISPTSQLIPPPDALLAAIHQRNATALRQALAQGASHNARNADGQPALTLAVMQRWADGVRILLDVGADRNARNNKGHTASDVALELGYSDMAQLLAPSK